MKLQSLLALALLVACSAPGTARKDTFSPGEVRDNASEFVRVVFGPAKPTLRDYQNYEGTDPGWEGQLALQACRDTFPGKNPEDDDGCKKYFNSRYEDSSNVESLYYRALREKLKLSPARLQIKNIEPTPAGDEYRIYLQTDGSPARTVIARHAMRRSLPELGLISIVEVDSRPIAEFLGLRHSGGSP
jgi:hypothetical protein